MRTTVLAIIVLAASARAEVVYNNLRPGGQFTPTYAYYSDMKFPNAYAELAWRLTFTGTGELERMRWSLFEQTSNTSVVFRIYSDDNGAPGSLLGAWTIEPPMWNGTTTAWEVTLEGHAFVRAGTPYFISIQLRRGVSTGRFVWWSSTNPTGPEVPTFYRPEGQSEWVQQFDTPIAGLELTVVDCPSADFNHDGDTGTDADIEAFFACISGACCATCGTADFNHDGDTGTDADIEAFFRVLAGGSC